MSRQYHSILLSLVIMASAAVASCGGSSAGLDHLDNLAPEGDVQADQPQHLEAAKPIMVPDKEMSGFGDLGDIIDIPDFGDIDFGLWWESLHVPVAHGDNDIPLDKYLAKSANTEEAAVIVGYDEVFPGIIIPVIGPGLDLKSSAGQMAYAQFGLSGIPDGEDVVKVNFDGVGSAGAGATHGIYLGMSNYNKDSYSWYGPYDLADGSWEVNMNIEDASSTGHAYLVIAVYDGDELVLQHLNVTVDNRIVIEIPDFEIPEIPDFGF